MATYSTGFQCPVTGQFLRARYAFGRVTITPALMNDEILDPATDAYCKRHSNKRFISFEEAEEYILEVAEGQAMGLDKD